MARVSSSFQFLLSTFLAIRMSEIDGPPKIFLPKDLDQPEELVIIGNNSQLTNTLNCGASNADGIQWRYLQQRNGGYQTIPLPFSQTSITQSSEGHLYISLTDADNSWRFREDLNGYYQCVANNNKGYTTITPPIRFILPGKLLVYLLEDGLGYVL